MACNTKKQNKLQELSHVTTLIREKFYFLWKIENFGENMYKKYEFPSPIYNPESDLETKWKMVLVPDHTYPEGVKVNLRLQKVSYDDIICSVMYTISIIDGEGKYHQKQIREKVFQYFLDSAECPVASNRELVEKNLLSNGSLTIHCTFELVSVDGQQAKFSCSYPPHYDCVLKNDLASVGTVDRSETKYEQIRPNLNKLVSVDGQQEKFSNSSPPHYDNVLKNDLASAGTADQSETKSGQNRSMPDTNSELTSDVTYSKPVKYRKNIEQLSEDLKSLYVSKYQTDVKIRVDDGELQAHRTILAARSEYFKQAMAQFSENPEVYIPEIKKVTLHEVLYYLYTGQLHSITYEVAMNLLVASKTLSLEKLQDEIENFLKTQITVNNVTDIVRISKEMKMSNLKNIALKFVAHNHDEVTKTEKWNQLIKNDPHTAGEVLLTIAAFQQRPAF